MNPPNITPGEWKVEVWDYSRATPPRKELNVQTADQLIATLQWDEGLDNPYTVQSPVAKANAAAIAALPALLDTLYTQYLRAVIDLDNAQQAGRTDEAERRALDVSEMKSALLAAGYTEPQN